MKAYTVTDEWGEGHAVVMFAKHNVVARRNGANALDLEFESVSCTRSPEFDSYAETGHVPPLVKIDHGWWMECWQCSARLDLDDYDDERPRSAMVEHGERVFCNAACMAAGDGQAAEWYLLMEISLTDMDQADFRALSPEGPAISLLPVPYPLEAAQ